MGLKLVLILRLHIFYNSRKLDINWGKILKIKILDPQAHFGRGNLYFIEAFFLFGGGVKIENLGQVITPLPPHPLDAYD